jgi:DNA repair photolyase
MQNSRLKGRGVHVNSPNRFEKLSIDPASYVEFYDEGFDEEHKTVKTEYYRDFSKSVLTKNESPDLGAGYSINPYRGCEHGCVYCYARPTHEFLGFSPGLDFETKIMVKHDAPELLEAEFRKKSWQPKTIFFSGNTDCYQPAERALGITRRCLEVFLKFRNPLVIITKNSLVRRDADLLKELSSMNLVSVIVTITTLKKDLQSKLEPRTSVPERRIETINYLSSHGVKVGVNVAPIIPGLTDEEIPAILKLASENGARFAGKVILRLPHSVKEIFTDWLRREYPERADKVLNRTREIHGGKLYDHTYGRRLTGEGIWADAISNVFDSSCRKYGLNEDRFHLNKELFRRDEDQISMFDS